MKELISSVKQLSKQELERANAKFQKQFHSPHEALGVVIEEVTEAKIEINHALEAFDDMLIPVIDNNNDVFLKVTEQLEDCAIKASAELIQVAAMARKCRLGYSSDKEK